MEASLTFSPTPAKDQANKNVTAGFKKLELKVTHHSLAGEFSKPRWTRVKIINAEANQGMAILIGSEDDVLEN
jgi:hypothetical protein